MRLCVAFLLSLIILGCPLSQAASVCLKKACVDVEVVSTQDDMKRGLQGRDSLAEGHGMLFVFNEEGLQRFWMKDMKFPIDIVWINKDHTIVAITPSVPACSSEPCEVYEPPYLASYVLEVPAGYMMREEWELGSKVIFKDVN